MFTKVRHCKRFHLVEVTYTMIQNHW